MPASPSAPKSKDQEEVDTHQVQADDRGHQKPEEHRIRADVVESGNRGSEQRARHQGGDQPRDAIRPPGSRRLGRPDGLLRDRGQGELGLAQRALAGPP
jgi:hypothetical protein